MLMRSLILLGLLVGGSTCLRAAVITVPDIEVAAGTSSVDVVVQITGGEMITGVTSAIVQLGDGGPLLGGSASTPKVTAVDFSNSIFFNLTTAPGGVDPITDLSLSLPSSVIDPGKTLLSPSTDFVAADGELFRFTVDTSSMGPGTVLPISMDTSATLGQTAVLELFGGGTAIPTFAPGGSISIAVIPEPSSFALLLSLTALGLVNRQLSRRRQRRKVFSS